MKIDKTLFIIIGTTQGLGFDIFNQLSTISENIVTINRSPFEYKNNINFDISDIDNIEKSLLSKLNELTKSYENLVLILNASIIEPVKEIGNYETHDIIKIVNVNILSSMILANFIVNQNKKGIVLNVSSGGIDFDFEGLGLYTATKIATHKFFSISNIENSNIEFINFDPSSMDTQMTISLKDKNNHFQVASRDYLMAKTRDKTFTSTKDSSAKLLKIIINKLNKR